MLTLGELSNRIDALKQLRRFNPDVPVYIDGAPAVTAHEQVSFVDRRKSRETVSVGFSLRTKDEVW